MLERILSLMQEQNINKNQLAKLTNIPRTTIYSALSSEENINKANLETIRPIAQVLNTTLDYIITGNNNNIDFVPNTIIAVASNGQKMTYNVSQEDVDLVVSLLSKLSKG